MSDPRRRFWGLYRGVVRDYDFAALSLRHRHDPSGSSVKTVANPAWGALA
jgi:hypothetical protein